MRSIILIIFILVAYVLPVQASQFEDMDICLGKAVVARALCKEPIEVNYVAKVKDNVYLFSVFYARQEVRFLVGVYENTIRVQGKEFMKLTNTLPYHFDADSKCGVVEFSSPDCPKSDPIVCCSEKTLDEKLDDKFWGRPIPELLDEDLRKALEEYEKEEGADGAKEGKGRENGKDGDASEQ